jgi:hypothetical protein
MFTEFLTDTSSGSWSNKSHEDKIYEISRQYPNLNFQDIDIIVKKQQTLRGLS